MEIYQNVDCVPSILGTRKKLCLHFQAYNVRALEMNKNKADKCFAKSVIEQCCQLLRLYIVGDNE